MRQTSIHPRLFASLVRAPRQVLRVLHLLLNVSPRPIVLEVIQPELQRPRVLRVIIQREVPQYQRCILGLHLPHWLEPERAQQVQLRAEIMYAPLPRVLLYRALEVMVSQLQGHAQRHLVGKLPQTEPTLTRGRQPLLQQMAEQRAPRQHQRLQYQACVRHQRFVM